jgi:hypothetical protein
VRCFRCFLGGNICFAQLGMVVSLVPGKPHWRGWLSTIDPLVLIKISCVWYWKNNYKTSFLRSFVLSFPLQLVFLVRYIPYLCDWFQRFYCSSTVIKYSTASSSPAHSSTITGSRSWPCTGSRPASVLCRRLTRSVSSPLELVYCTLYQCFKLIINV